MSEADISMQTSDATAVRPRSEGLPMDVAFGSSKVTAISILQRLLSFPMMLVALLIGGVFVARRDFDVDPDFWWHLKVGEDILRTHHWPTVDTYSFTAAGQAWFPAEWLGGVLFASVERIAGLRGLEALLIILGASIVVALYAFSTLRCGNSKAGFVASAALMVLATANFSLRPQMLGYLFLILTLVVLERFRAGKSRDLWFLPLLFLVWVNTHGSFVIGMAAIAAYWLGGLTEFHVGNIEARRWSDAERMRLEIIFLLCLLALTITPYGGQLAVYPFHVAFSLPIGVANVEEWEPMPFSLFGGKWFLALILGFLVTQMTRRFKWRLEEVMLFLFGTTMACFHARFLLIFVPCFAPLLATVIALWVPPYAPSKDRYALNAILMTMIVAGMIRYFPATAEIEADIAKAFPVQAVQYLRQHPVPRPMFNTYNFGGYLVWAGEKVFVDGRADPYERGGSLADYFHVSKLQPGALAVLQGYGVRSCLLQRGEALTTMLAALPEWQQAYADNLSVLFVRRQNDPFVPAAYGQPRSGGKE
jgi:hypothetical protein